MYYNYIPATSALQDVLPSVEGLESLVKGEQGTSVNGKMESTDHKTDASSSSSSSSSTADAATSDTSTTSTTSTITAPTPAHNSVTELVKPTTAEVSSSPSSSSSYDLSVSDGHTDLAAKPHLTLEQFTQFIQLKVKDLLCCA